MKKVFHKFLPVRQHNRKHRAMPRTIKILLLLWLIPTTQLVPAQSWKLSPENIERAITTFQAEEDPFRPGFHLTPPAGCMGDPNGGIRHDGWYHIFYGLQPFAYHPGAWYWAHARSRDLVRWEHMEPRLTPPFDLGLHAIGSGSTIVTEEGQAMAFYSQSREGPMEFWRAVFTGADLNGWSHEGKNPILTLDHPGLPPFDGFWRDPYVFRAEGRTFLIACADLFESDVVPVPVFEANNPELTQWEYKGILFSLPKHLYRNLEVPELRPLGDQWIFLASTDAPVDRVNYFLGNLDLDNLSFSVEQKGIIDYSGHYYAQETIPGEDGSLYLMAWLPGWDREWLPYYMNEPLKNANQVWNGCFALPRKLTLENGQLIQQPVKALQALRKDPVVMEALELPVRNAMTATRVLEGFRGNQVEIRARFLLHNASFCGINVLTDSTGTGGLAIAWSGNLLNVDGVHVPLEDWEHGEPLDLQIFVDRKFVEVFVNGGRYCISRQVREEHVRGDFVALTSLGGKGILEQLQAWQMSSVNPIEIQKP